MNDKEIKQGRKKYNKIQKEKQFYLSKKAELEELKKDPKVQQYLEVAKYLFNHSDKEFENNNVVERSFANLASRTKDSNNILVFLGFIDYYDKVTIHPKKIDHASFIDLETMEECNVHPAYYSEFCKDKKIVYFDDPYSFHNKEYYMQKFFEFRNEYFKNIIELNQEDAIEKVLKER